MRSRSRINNVAAPWRDQRALGGRKQLVRCPQMLAISSTIVSNPPYIVRRATPHLSQGDLRFEPALALADAVDGWELPSALSLGQ